MIDTFIFWLNSIVEDSPIPDEVENIVFVVKENGDYRYLELRGYEETININSIFFRPLEAEFFTLTNLYHKGANVFIYKLKSMIDEAFFADGLKWQFKNRKIYLLYNDKLEYLFSIN